MKSKQSSQDFVVDVLVQSKIVRDALSRYRTTLGRPDATATECEKYATDLLKKVGDAGPQPSVRTRTAARRKGAPKNSIALGRQQVLQGKRPKLVDAIVKVMGKETLKCPEVFNRLKKKGWLPVTAKPSGYISYTMSDNPEIFTRVKRGHYRVNAK